MATTIPIEIVYEILSYDERFAIRSGKLMNRISKNDKRYRILKKIPLKNYSLWHSGYFVCLYISKTKKYMFLVNDNNNFCNLYLEKFKEYGYRSSYIELLY
jgi:hypothetical protein